MNPHFLFNALNTVAELVRIDAVRAEQAVENLAGVLRQTLHRSARPMTTVEDEARFVRAYLEIERERLGPRLEVTMAIDDAARGCQIPTMSLQPLVENALKHAVGSRLEGGSIRVSARTDGTRLLIGVDDTGSGFPPGYTPGTGLSNLRQRLTVLIVDDELAARTRLARLLGELHVEVAGEAANGLEALEQLARLRPDVILLDIEMPEVTGLDVARRLPDRNTLVVFQTAYDQYALAAFEREAVDYLLKPVTKERLADALARARRRLAERTGWRAMTPDLAGRLEAVLRRDAPPRRPRRLLVRHQNGHRLMPVAEIDRFVAGDGVVSACTRQSQHLVDDTLDDLERRLAGVFVRTSRGDLVAIDRVDRIVSNGDGSLTLTLKDGSPIRVSRRRSSGVRAALERF